MVKKTENNKTPNSERKKLFDKIKPKEKLTEKDRKEIKIAFNILALFCIVLFCIAIAPKALQNDTFYTIKIGQLIRTNGIDYIDHFSWHDLEYLYPHWLYDLGLSLVYDYMGGFAGVYISTIILTVLLGLAIYLANKKICKNDLVSLVMSMAQMYMLRPYLAARAQLVTFILFALTIYFIEKYLEKPKVKYAVALLLIPIAIANVHSAVFPFYFVIYLPYIGEYLLRVLMDWHLAHKLYEFHLKHQIKITNKKLKKAQKENAVAYQSKLAELNKKVEESNAKFEKFVIGQNNRRKKPYRIKLERNNNTIGLIIIMCIALFTGLLTPLRDMPYTYTLRIMKGNTTKSVSEHLPLTLIENQKIMIALTGTLALLIFTKVKIRLRDLFFVGGLTLLSFMTRRQVSMLDIFGGFVIARMVTELLEYYDKKGLESMERYMTSITGQILTILLLLSICYTQFKPNITSAYIDPKSYPTEATTWIKENLDYENMKIFNDYNYGSYLLFNDIPVFVDSRCDLYTPEFNGEYDKEKKKFVGQDIFSDYISVSSIGTYYETKFEEYGITHVIAKTNSKLNMLLSRDDNYKELYKDDYFIIYERLSIEGGKDE